ncbi:MAG TPA: hypothetical protein VFP61_12485, partial [Acidimicrobiales bacterium]|nr:hypothetical protein [Acidimicrobiales bacterium]
TTGPQAVRLVAAGQRGPLRMTATVAARPLHRAVRRRLYRRHSTPGVGRPGATTSPPVAPAAGSGARPDPGTPT